ncbi:MAG: endonuclease III domain-containing protein [bacterium JZ-2024 1]
MYGEEKHIPDEPIFWIFIRGILSQNTNDRLRDRAYALLRRRFPTPERLSEAKAEEITPLIRACGLANLKTRRILHFLHFVKEHYPDFDLSPICHKPVSEVEKEFLSVPGIGIKTLRVALAFACKKEVFPVDTHIFRVSRRLGWIPEKATREKAHHLLPPFIPKGKSLSFHLNLIEFGRKICTARNPRCGICPFRSLCVLGPYPQKSSPSR